MKVYPIPATLIPSSGVPMKVEIVKVAAIGFMVQMTDPQNWQTGDRFTIQFSLPLSDSNLNEPVKLVKTYLKWTQFPASPTAATVASGAPPPAAGPPAPAEKTKLQIFEMHFLSLAPQKRSVIEQFVVLTDSGDKSGS